MNKIALLNIKNIFYKYNIGKYILKNINLKIYNQDFIAIIGPNGSGKSTFLKLILGLLKPTTGTIFFHDSLLKNKSKISYVPQNTGLDINFPIKTKELVVMGFLNSKLYGCFYKKQHYEKVNKILYTLDLYNYREKNISELSEGQLQKAIIARALVNDPSLLLLDEPTNYIDDYSKKKLIIQLKEYNKKSTIIMITHDINLVKKVTKKIIVIKNYLSFYNHTNIINNSYCKNETD